MQRGISTGDSVANLKLYHGDLMRSIADITEPGCLHSCHNGRGAGFMSMQLATYPNAIAFISVLNTTIKDERKEGDLGRLWSKTLTISGRIVVQLATERSCGCKQHGQKLLVPHIHVSIPSRAHGPTSGISNSARSLHSWPRRQAITSLSSLSRLRLTLATCTQHAVRLNLAFLHWQYSGRRSRRYTEE